jgi:hypothetical protein
MLAPPNYNSSPSKKKSGKSRRGWVVSAALGFLGLLAILLLSNYSSKDHDAPVVTEGQKPKKVQRKPAPSMPSKSGAEANVKKEVAKPAMPQRIGEVRDGYRLLPSGRLHKVRGIVEIKNTDNSGLENIFPEPADQLIAGLITIEPGDFLVGDTGTMFENFDVQFKTALKHPIQINPEDDEETRELKEAVNETRQELLEHRKNGNDLSQVMADTRHQLQELGLYRNELNEMVKKMLDDGNLNDKDYEDLIAAANQMLDDRGCKPLELPKTFKRYVQMIGEDYSTESER